MRRSTLLALVALLALASVPAAAQKQRAEPKRPKLAEDLNFFMAKSALAQVALDAQQKHGDALAVYQQFLARSPKRTIVFNVKAGERVKALQAAGVSPASITAGTLPASSTQTP